MVHAEAGIDNKIGSFAFDSIRYLLGKDGLERLFGHFRCRLQYFGETSALTSQASLFARPSTQLKQAPGKGNDVREIVKKFPFQTNDCDFFDLNTIVFNVLETNV